MYHKNRQNLTQPLYWQVLQDEKSILHLKNCIHFNPLVLFKDLQNTISRWTDSRC